MRGEPHSPEPRSRLCRQTSRPRHRLPFNSEPRAPILRGELPGDPLLSSCRSSATLRSTVSERVAPETCPHSGSELQDSTRSARVCGRPGGFATQPLFGRNQPQQLAARAKFGRNRPYPAELGQHMFDLGLNLAASGTSLVNPAPDFVKRR